LSCEEVPGTAAYNDFYMALFYRGEKKVTS